MKKSIFAIAMNTPKKLLLFILLFSIKFVLAQQPDSEGSFVKWMTIEEALEKVKTEPRPIILDFYTDWCGWCKTMMRTTYADRDLSQYINSYFYPAKFNAEGKDTVEFLGKKYFPLSSQPRETHPLTTRLLGNKLMYPTTLFLNGYEKEKNEFRLNLTANGYLESKKMEPMLVFTLENVWRNSNFDEFNLRFEQTFYDSTTELKQKKADWIKPTDFFTTDTTKSKKTLVMIHNVWCNSCKVMKRTSFIDTTINKYITEKFNLVDFDAIVDDTLFYKNKKYYNLKKPETPFNLLSYALSRNTIIFPTLVVLDENLEIIDVIPSYISPEFLNQIAHFYGENYYKTKSWSDFLKVNKNNN